MQRPGVALGGSAPAWHRAPGAALRPVLGAAGPPVPCRYLPARGCSPSPAAALSARPEHCPRFLPASIVPRPGELLLRQHHRLRPAPSQSSGAAAASRGWRTLRRRLSPRVPGCLSRVGWGSPATLGDSQLCLSPGCPAPALRCGAVRGNSAPTPSACSSRRALARPQTQQFPLSPGSARPKLLLALQTAELCSAQPRTFPAASSSLSTARASFITWVCWLGRGTLGSIPCGRSWQRRICWRIVLFLSPQSHQTQLA